MKKSSRLQAISALATVIFLAVFVITLIIGIWTDFDSSTLGRTSATAFILFFSSALLHSLSKGMSEASKD